VAAYTRRKQGSFGSSTRAIWHGGCDVSSASRYVRRLGSRRLVFYVRPVPVVFLDSLVSRPSYFVELTLIDGRISWIRDFRFASYVLQHATIELASPR
jgi:hypothetical protein